VAPSSNPTILVPSPEERLEFTGERFVPGTPGEIEHEHLHRYFFALNFCRDRDVLDVASGEGYGSAVLATAARSVVGVELVPEVVEHAIRSYRRPNLEFRVGDCAKLPVADASIDVVVSFETLEHVERQLEFLTEIKRVLRADGLLVLSSPVRGIYSPDNPNPFHVKELTRAELRELIGRYFHHMVSMGQTPVVGSAIVPEDERQGSPAIEERVYWRQESGSFTVEGGVGSSPYLLIVASDGALPPIEAGFLQDRPYLARLLGALQEGREQANALKAQIAQSDSQVAALEQASTAQQLEIGRLARDLESTGRELDARTTEHTRSLEAISKLDREVQGLREALAEATRWTWGNLPSKVVRGLKRRARRTLSELRPARITDLVRRQRLVTRIAATGLFDKGYYLATYPDVASAGFDPIEHYVIHGASEGRNPHRCFDTAYYAAQNPDVTATGTNPLLHFALTGMAQGRRPHPGYSAEEYLAATQRDSDALKNAQQETETPREAIWPRATQEPPAVSTLPPSRFQTRPLSEQRHPFGEKSSLARTIAVSHVLPYPPRAGNEYRIYRLLRWLHSIGHEVHLVVSPLPGEALDAELVNRAAGEYPNLIVCQRDGTLLYQSENPDVRSMLEAHSGQRPRQLASEETGSGDVRSEKVLGLEMVFCPDHLIEILIDLQEVVRPQAVISNYVFMSRFLPLLDEPVLKIIDTHDVFSTKSSKVVRFGIHDDLVLTTREEAGLLRRADLIVAIQPEEREELREIAPDRPIVTAGVDFDLFAGASAQAHDLVVLFVGSGNALNVKGARDFLALAWPLIRRQVPNARMRIVGPVCESLEEGIEGVELLGRVDRLDEVYAGATVVVNPAVAGTGLKIKTLEALSHLRPIVVWPSGIEGLPEVARRFCVVSNDWYDFARRVAQELVGNRADELVKHREEIGRQLSADFVYAELGAAIAARIQSGASKEARRE
jgi:SAM-dependent methyltransferase